jgi:STE24 endopeptidase
MTSVATLAFLLFLNPFHVAPGHLRHAVPNAPVRSAISMAQQATGAGTNAARIQAPQNVTSYTLPPDLYRKAKNLARIGFRLELISFFYGLAVLWLALHFRIAPKYRDWAKSISSNRFAQAFVFSPLLALTLAVLLLPPSLYEHVILRAYGLSIEGWGPWAWDWAKGILLLIVIASPLVWILYAVIRRSPRRWWFYFWLISLPILLFVSFVEPFLIEPIFFKFAPLTQKDPALVAQIEQIVHRAGVDIPPDRMFWMKASDKTPTMNAYVTGIGASKRVVIWDTTISNETTPEIVSVVGHELGHYVLGHVWKGLIFGAALLFIVLYLGYRSIGWMLARWGSGWAIHGLDDWASLPALLLLLSIFNFISAPVSNAYSRHIEHQADVYGLEITHGLIPNASQAAADSFEVEGEYALADPSPNPVNVFLFYDHPPIADRIRFCLTYDPWSNGHHPEFVNK